ncbi:ERMES complex subunit MDM34 NDAI_0I02970 [Naumovozyma dairenensis CBS 421]|uniref:SMP-LTD domain-containing protein n=1 Tax=Naumovozyma dairenensis (strain ATCC 10597 / BCRC 20456 / CBS 421 / NBRC 0211 / NRRL Y-12639) TaxID=1071378 RepID=G0WGF4_NAUDC|nr:hypothetical protein NDAI_0I02970 [Naumovozyma dairenensis CBS 421]CCD26865.1 hypothetical protein NDAI_0I02970 [Naumovozyma dairenensis CBS 421]
MKPHSNKLSILKSGIIVRKVNFPIIPNIEILDLDITTAQPSSRSLLKGICKISCKDATLQIQTVIESNLLLLNLQDSPLFTTPNMINNNSFQIPITMTFTKINLEAIVNLFMKNHGVSISFNDVTLNFNFDCSIKILQSTIEKRLKDSMRLVFEEILPTVIFNMSQNWFSTSSIQQQYQHQQQLQQQQQQQQQSVETVSSLPTSIKPKIIFDESDLQDFSPTNMLRLSTIVSSRHTLALPFLKLNSLSTIHGCLERQNLFKFISRMPSLNNYTSAQLTDMKLPHFDDDNNKTRRRISNIDRPQLNLLSKDTLDNHLYELTTITEIQNHLFERSTSDQTVPRRRKIKLNRKTRKDRQEVKDEKPSIHDDNNIVDSLRNTDNNSIIIPRPLSPVDSMIFNRNIMTPISTHTIIKEQEREQEQEPIHIIDDITTSTTNTTIPEIKTFSKKSSNGSFYNETRYFKLSEKALNFLQPSTSSKDDNHNNNITMTNKNDTISTTCTNTDTNTNTNTNKIPYIYTNNNNIQDLDTNKKRLNFIGTGITPIWKWGIHEDQPPPYS